MRSITGNLFLEPVVILPDAQFAHPGVDSLGGEAGYHGDLDSRRLCRLDAQSVLDVEALDDLSPGIVVESAIGQDAVDVEDQEAHPLRPSERIHGRSSRWQGIQ
jgi:hypothetical protein